jgi:hypothetical protein
MAAGISNMARGNAEACSLQLGNSRCIVTLLYCIATIVRSFLFPSSSSKCIDNVYLILCLYHALKVILFIRPKVSLAEQKMMK